MADTSTPPMLIWCEADSDEAALLQAAERIRAAQEAQARHAERQRAQAIAGADLQHLLRRARPHLAARRTMLEWSARNAFTDHSREQDERTLREVAALIDAIDQALKP